MNRKDDCRKKRELVQSLVFYADILGFSSMVLAEIEEERGNALLKRIADSLAEARKGIEKNNLHLGGEEDFQVKFFTDNLVISFPVKNFNFDAAEPELETIIRIISEYQIRLAMDGFFIRGGLSFGLNYMDRDIVFGDAIVKAHNMDKKGNPPRIVLSSELGEIVKTQFGFYNNSYSAPQYQELLIDVDGKIFINYLNEAFRVFPEGGIFFEVLQKHKSNIEKNLGRFSDCTDIRNKYEWIARYHNFICNEIAYLYPPSSNPDQDIEYAFASEEAQKTLDFILPGQEKALISRIDPSTI